MPFRSLLLVTALPLLSGTRIWYVAPPGAVNQGPYDISTWKYGNAFQSPPGTKIWNPAKIKLMKADPVAMEAQREDIKARYSRIFGA